MIFSIIVIIETLEMTKKMLVAIFDYFLKFKKLSEYQN